MTAGEERTLPGWVAPALDDELEGLGLRYIVCGRGAERTPREVRQRLRTLANRISGAEAVVLRQRPVPWAYRVFFRHIGLDPDSVRTPIEEIVLERMRRGGFRHTNLVGDALTIATVETGLALRAFDADRVDGVPGIRSSAPGERMKGRTTPLSPGTLVIADERSVLGYLFGPTAKDRAVGRRTKRTLVSAIQVKGVPEIVVEEGLWLAGEVLRADAAAVEGPAEG